MVTIISGCEVSRYLSRHVDWEHFNQLSEAFLPSFPGLDLAGSAWFLREGRCCERPLPSGRDGARGQDDHRTGFRWHFPLSLESQEAAVATAEIFQASQENSVERPDGTTGLLAGSFTFYWETRAGGRCYHWYSSAEWAASLFCPLLATSSLQESGSPIGEEPIVLSIFRCSLLSLLTTEILFGLKTQN